MRLTGVLTLDNSDRRSDKTDRDRDELVGPIKRVEAYLIDFVKKDNGIVEARRRWYTTTYNTDGNISEKVTYDQSGPTEKLVYTYDANGRSTGYEEYPWTRKTRLIQSDKGGPPQPSHAQLRIITY